MAALVDQLILESADISVVNRTTLSLWHFQHVSLPLLPIAEPVDAADAEPPDAEAATSKTPIAPSLELGEGMQVAAVSLCHENDIERAEQVSGEESKALQSEPDALTAGSILAGMQLTPSSQVSIVYKRYRCVICLDGSPSTLAIDPVTGRLFLDLLYEAVEVRSWRSGYPFMVFLTVVRSVVVHLGIAVTHGDRRYDIHA